MRLALLLDSSTQPAWVCRLIETIGDEIAAVEVRPTPKRVRSFLERIDTAKFAKADDALAPRVVTRIGGSIAGADVILDFTGRERGTNVWTLHHDALADFVDQLPSTTAELRANGVVIARIDARTDPISLHRGLSRLGWKSGVAIARAIGAQTSIEPVAGRTPSERTAGRSPYLAAARSAGRYIRQQIIDRLMHEQWLVGVRFGTRGPFCAITPPDDRLWADPFVIVVGESVFVFVEELKYGEGRAAIAVMELRRDGTASASRRVLERPYHLSYPCVFRWNGDYYMLPETEENGTVELYRCRSFPGEWEPSAVLMRGIRAVDATMFEHAGRWWMYLSTAPDGETHDELLLFHADSPLGPWSPHPRNPILSSVMGGRCAGRPFVREGHLLRAAQIGGRRYGHSIQLREIVTLTVEECVERVVETIQPNWNSGLAGAHTYNVDGDVTVIDGLRYRWGSS